MNINELENIEDRTHEEHSKILEGEIATLRQTVNEKDKRIAYLNAVIDAYEECTQKFADLVIKIGNKQGTKI